MEVQDQVFTVFPGARKDHSIPRILSQRIETWSLRDCRRRQAGNDQPQG
jgi:hypothetical protein